MVMIIEKGYKNTTLKASVISQFAIEIDSVSEFER